MGSRAGGPGYSLTDTHDKYYLKQPRPITDTWVVQGGGSGELSDRHTRQILSETAKSHYRHMGSRSGGPGYSLTGTHDKYYLKQPSPYLDHCYQKTALSQYYTDMHMVIMLIYNLNLKNDTY